MNRRRFLFVPFSEPLSEVLLRCEPQNALFIFPTAAAKRDAWQAFQKRWQFEETVFLTMEEWKELLLAADKPLLREEKRTLAFYACLNEEDKKALHVDDYFQCIEPAQRFFDIWEEFNEELLADEIDEQLLVAGDAELLPWQRDLHHRFLDIKERYRQFIEQKGFCDALFLLKTELLNWNTLATFKRVYFVNQFYYTALERSIINRLIQGEIDVTLIYQLPEELLDQETLAVRPFNIGQLGCGRNEGIEVIECPNAAVMTTALMQRVEKRLVRHVINFNERLEPTVALLSPRFFHVGDTVRFEQTSIFRLLQALHRLLASLFWEPKRKKLLVPLSAIIDFLLAEETNRLLFADEPPLRRRALAACSQYIDQQVQFFDLDGEVFYFFPHRDAQTAWQRISRTILLLLSIGSLKDAANLLERKLGAVVHEILTKEEKEYSDILEVYYRATADFLALETTGLFEQPDALFHDRSLTAVTQIPCGVLRLFLDYLKSLRIHFHLSAGDSPRVEFINLLDTRNLAFKSVAVMNVVEKVLPHPRREPFLFTEKQRRLLGLKTYDDILLREKYYFFRLLLSTPRVFLFTQRNLEENIEPSSFIEELFLFYDSEKLILTKENETDYAGLLSRFTNSDASYLPDSSAVRSESFYCLPFDRQQDLPTGSLDLSYTALSSLRKNPFAFYLEHLTGLRERNRQVHREFSALLLGNIVHEWLNVVWRSLLEEQGVSAITLDFSRPKLSLIKQSIDRILRADAYYFRLPHNHTDVYFYEIMVPHLAQSIEGFLHFLHRLGLSEKTLAVFPEQTAGFSSEKYISFFEVDGVQVRVGGRADLRIEELKEDQKYIFDYKTGAYDVDQLVLYELYYYTVAHPGLTDRIQSFFYLLTDDQPVGIGNKSKQFLYEEFKRNLLQTVERVMREGFYLPQQRSDLDSAADITRGDLYKMRLSLKEPFFT